MSDIDLLDLIIMQVGDLRVPACDRELVKNIWAIRGNLEALKEAMEQARKEDNNDVPSGGDNDHPVEG